MVVLSVKRSGLIERTPLWLYPVAYGHKGGRKHKWPIGGT